MYLGHLWQNDWPMSCWYCPGSHFKQSRRARMCSKITLSYRPAAQPVCLLGHAVIGTQEALFVRSCHTLPKGHTQRAMQRVLEELYAEPVPRVSQTGFGSEQLCTRRVMALKEHRFVQCPYLGVQGEAQDLKIKPSGQNGDGITEISLNIVRCVGKLVGAMIGRMAEGVGGSRFVGARIGVRVAIGKGCLLVMVGCKLVYE